MLFTISEQRNVQVLPDSRAVPRMRHLRVDVLLHLSSGSLVAPTLRKRFSENIPATSTDELDDVRASKSLRVTLATFFGFWLSKNDAIFQHDVILNGSDVPTKYLILSKRALLNAKYFYIETIQTFPGNLKIVLQFSETKLKQRNSRIWKNLVICGKIVDTTMTLHIT